MAKKIEQIEKHIPNKIEENADAINQILAKIAQNQKSVTVFLEIIEELHEAGVLDMVKGLLKTRDKVGALAIQQLNQPSAHRIIKNGMGAVQTLSQIDPNHLATMMNGLTNGLKESNEVEGERERISMWGMFRMMRDPDVNASLKTMIGFMQGMGKALNDKTANEGS
jgi:uncharacterized protein YjgD (DUF1641 family)